MWRVTIVHVLKEHGTQKIFFKYLGRVMVMQICFTRLFKSVHFFKEIISIPKCFFVLFYICEDHHRVYFVG